MNRSNRRLDEQLSEITRQLSGKDSEEVKDLEERRNKLRENQSTNNHSKWLLESTIDELQKLIEFKERERDEAEKWSAKEKIAHQRVQVATEAGKALSRILDLRTDQVRQLLDMKIKEVYAKISFKPYAPRLDSNFRLQLGRGSEDGDDIVSKSTGESQILSLAFVGALAALAAERYREIADEGRQITSLLSYYGGIYPIVMDSPFGALDENYRRDVARAIPVLAPQVVVFVSKSQGLGAVYDEMLPRISRQYVIAYHTPKPGADDESITLKGRDFPYIVKDSQGPEWAELLEV